MRAWLADNVRVVDEHPALRAYAVVLSLLHALTGVAWFTYKNVATLVTGEDAVCWPIFPECERVRAHLSEGIARGAVVGYIAIAIVAAALFASRRRRAAFASFVAASVVGAAIYALDYRMRMNQSYMFAWIVVAFVLAPKKTQVIQALIALFYFWAGTLKLHREWISGAALYAKPYLVPDALVPAACVYVLVLELVLVWWLFASHPRWARWAVYAQLVVFHAVSWGTVGYFYPLLMLGLTAIYPLVWRRAPGDALTFRSVRDDAKVRLAVLATAGAFSAFQIVPHLFPGDTAVTGEGRIFALHMFDAKVECEGGAILRGASGPIARAPLINDHLDVRTRCDPIVLVATAKRLCRTIAARSDVTRVDIAIDARRATDARMAPLIHVDDFCATRIDYSPWRHNAWIGGGGP